MEKSDKEVSFGSDITLFVNRLDETWRHRQSHQSELGKSVYTMLDSYFSSSPNPYSAFLDLIDCLLSTPLKYQMKLCECAWKSFSSWVEEQSPANANEFLDRGVLERAAHIALRDNLKNFSTACAIFKFSDLSHDIVTEVFSKKVIELTSMKKYRAIASIFNHFSHILSPAELLDDDSLRHLSIFLVSKKEGALLRKILDKKIPNDRLYRLFNFLDSVVDAEAQAKNIPVSGDEAETETVIELSHSSECSVITKLCEDLSVPFSFCPNVTFIWLKETTEFLVSATFGDEAEMDLVTFREYICDFAKLDQRYSSFVLNYLSRVGHVDAAIYFANKLGISDMKISAQIGTTILQSNSKQSQDSEKYKLPLPDDKIIFIDTVESYRSALNHIFSLSKESQYIHKMVGIDTEWPAFLLPDRKKLVSILQLALHDRVFIIDFENLSQKLTTADWSLLVKFFSSTDVLKVTFAFKSDMWMLEKCFPEHFRNFELASNADLEDLTVQVWKALRAVNCGPIRVGKHNDVVLDVSKPVPTSLSDVAKAFLGCHVSKMFRLSNWSRRPLDSPQLFYAAIDAYCLLDIYRELRVVVAQQLHDDSTSFINSLESVVSKVTLGNRKLKPCDIRLVCYFSLMDLGTYLKQLGFDVKVTDAESDFEFCLKNASQDRRTFITNEHLVANFSEEVAVVGVPLASVEDQAKFISIRLNADVDCDENKPGVDSNPIQRVHQIAAHLPDRGSTYCDIEPDPTRQDDEPPFTATCLVNFSNGNTLKSLAFGATKHDAKKRAASNMVIMLNSFSEQHS